MTANVFIGSHNGSYDFSLKFIGLSAAADAEGGNQLYNPTIYPGPITSCTNDDGCEEVTYSIITYCWIPGTENCTQSVYYETEIYC